MRLLATAALPNCQIQSFGAFIAIDKRTQLMCACSANTYSFVGKTPEELLGQKWSLLFAPAQVEGVFKHVEASRNEVPQILRTEFQHRPVLVANHTVGNMTLVEIEHYQSDFFQFNFSDTVAYLHALAATHTVEAAAKLLMKTIAGITQFDRVMLYKFLPDWHGEVIGESLFRDRGLPWPKVSGNRCARQRKTTVSSHLATCDCRRLF